MQGPDGHKCRSLSGCWDVQPLFKLQRHRGPYIHRRWAQTAASSITVLLLIPFALLQNVFLITGTEQTQQASVSSEMIHTGSYLASCSTSCKQLLSRSSSGMTLCRPWWRTEPLLNGKITYSDFSYSFCSQRGVNKKIDRWHFAEQRVILFLVPLSISSKNISDNQDFKPLQVWKKAIVNSSDISKHPCTISRYEWHPLLIFKILFFWLTEPQPLHWQKTRAL